MGKIVGFLQSWLSEAVDGQKVGMWLKPHPSDPTQGLCMVCPGPGGGAAGHPSLGKSFSIREGFVAIVKHAGGKKHKMLMEKIVSDPNHNIFQKKEKQISIQDAVKKQESLKEEETLKSQKLLKAQILWSYAIHSHGIASKFFDCSSELFPQMFEDSAVGREWGKPGKGLRQGKGDYFATDGIHPFLKNQLVQKLRESHFSLNIDESTVLKSSQLDINVSYWDRDTKCIVKRNLTTVSMEGGTTAEEIVNVVLKELDDDSIPSENLVSLTTDGCSTMLGEKSGVHARLRKVLPHLPDLGGCTSHDASNTLKASVKKLHLDIVSLFHALPSYISSQSIHRFRSFAETCEKIGFDTSNPPKMFEVRFRVIPLLAEWMEKESRGLYVFIKEQLHDVVRGRREPTETELVVIKLFLDNYIDTRLTCMFLLDVSQELLSFLDTFEKEEVKLHLKYEKIVSLIYVYAAKFLRNAGLCEDTAKVTSEALLEIDPAEEKGWLPLKDLVLGKRVDSFLEEQNLERNHEVLKPFIQGVQAFYVEFFRRLIKYYKPSLNSRILQYCSVLSPDTVKIMAAERLANRFKYLGAKFPNIIPQEDLHDLACEGKLLKTISLSGVRKPEMFIRRLETYEDDDDKTMFPLITKLGCALLTIYNSSSTVERDFSIQVNYLAFNLLIKYKQIQFHKILT